MAAQVDTDKCTEALVARPPCRNRTAMVILLDIETQRDFFLRGRSCCAKPATEAAGQVRRLFDWVRAENVPVISTVLRVRRHKPNPMGGAPYCVEGTTGEQKLPRTVLPRYINLGLRNITDLPVDLFGNYQQVIFEKRVTDIFRHARIERLITALPLSTFVICGAGVARGIVEAAIGLRWRGHSVILATDAVLALGDPLAEAACRRMDAKGVIFWTTAKITSLRRTPPMAGAEAKPVGEKLTRLNPAASTGKLSWPTLALRPWNETGPSILAAHGHESLSASKHSVTRNGGG